jgi:hypothetical protein
MKIFSKYIALSLAVLLLSCKEDKATPKVTYDKTILPRSESVVAESKILVADLPVQMVGTNYLLYPIGEFSVSDKNSSKYSGLERSSFTVSNASENEITGYLSNFKFQLIGSDSLKVLTDKPILIERVTYLKSIAEKTKKQFLVYILEDMDSNKDGKLDSNDIRDLYISDISGENFTKLSKDFHELIDWNVIDSQNRLYFRTIEDINKNGAFDKDDKVHYQYVDLISKELKVVQYTIVNQ